MAKTVINPEAELESRTGDVELTLDQLGLLGVFASLKKGPAFAKFPGTYIMRHYRPGDVICRQGEAGGTAFYMLTGKDLAALASPPPQAEQGTPPVDAPVCRRIEATAQRIGAASDDGTPRQVSDRQIDRRSAG